MKGSYLILCTFLFSFSLCKAQENQPTQYDRTGKIYVFWGYNRSMYSNSDIHLKGPGYDYTLKGTRAKDYPTPFRSDIYLNIFKFTVPQFNFRMGYYLNNKYSLSLGWDHLKYVLDNSQVGMIDGYITDEARDDWSKTNSYQTDKYIGDFDDREILLNKPFIKYEHTDGLNFIRASIDRHDELHASANGKVKFELISSLGLGPILTWTDFTHLSGRRYKNNLYFSGGGIAYHSGVRAELFHTFFIQGNIGGGYVYLPWVNTKHGEPDRASQHFGYAEFNLVAGFYFNPKRIFPKTKK